ncbi:MAG: tetratricopeptide repeat protein [Alphaproteobacteria bacterium]|nr:tetratricopeptide repeat protein [Alphaproteobacteria bacterium]
MKKKTKDILAEDALINEISEEVKNDQLKVLWEKYGLFIIIFVALALTAAVSFETFKAWINKKNQEISNAYAVAISLQDQGKTDESFAILKTIADKSTIYSDLAKLQIANIYMLQNKKDEARNILNSLAEGNSETKQIKEIATLKLAMILLDENAPDTEIKSLLSPLINEENHNYNVAHEILAMLALRDGNFEEAKKEYEHIIASANSSDEIKSRAQDMITVINDMTK